MELTVKLSARNTLSGKVVELKMGQTTSHVKLDIGGGHIVTASITNEAVDDLLGAAWPPEAHAVCTELAYPSMPNC